MKAIAAHNVLFLLILQLIFCNCSNEQATETIVIEVSNEAAIDQSYDAEIPSQEMDSIGSIEAEVMSILEQTTSLQQVNSNRTDLDSNPVEYVEYRNDQGERIRIDFIPSGRKHYIQYTWIRNNQEWIWLGKRTFSATNERDSFQESFFIHNDKPFAYKDQEISLNQSDIKTYYPQEAFTWLNKMMLE